MNDFFNTRESEGRYNWLLVNIRDILRGKKCILFTDDPFCTYDFEMTAWTSSVTTSYGEIKTVHRDYALYPNFQIDYWKLKHLQEKCTKDNRIAYVVGFFTDCLLVWDITKIDLEERRYTQFCTSTTADYEKGKQEKEEVWLVKEEAIYKEEKES